MKCDEGSSDQPKPAPWDELAGGGQEKARTHP